MGKGIDGDEQQNNVEMEEIELVTKGSALKHTLPQQVKMLVVFMLPLALTQMVPDLAEQVS